MSEFSLINRYFCWDTSQASIIEAVGDDAAIIQPECSEYQVVSTDTFIEGVHFPMHTEPKAIGHKALAVNLSDLAAMGAEPSWFTLALTLPEIDHVWMEKFVDGMKTLATQHQIPLVGGDTTKGPLSITITVAGHVPKGKELKRSSAKHGDYLFVTGALGVASIGLAHLQNRMSYMDAAQKAQAVEKLNYPSPKLREASLIREYSRCCIDLSDGLITDLGHILQSSHVGAVIDIQSIPLGDGYETVPLLERQQAALYGGDDYELLFTVSEDKLTGFQSAIQDEGLLCYGVGRIDTHVQDVVDERGDPVLMHGYDHFLGSGA